MADLILPESYLLMTVIIIKLEVELFDTPFYRFIRRTLLKSRLEDLYNTRGIMRQVEYLRGDKLYQSLPYDSVILEYLYKGNFIDSYERCQYKKSDAKKRALEAYENK